MRLLPTSSESRLWPVLCFGGFLLLGLIITPDFGLYIDEFTNHFFGVTWYDYVYNILVNGAPVEPLASATQHDVLHGPVFEVALAWIVKMFLPSLDLSQIVIFRHYATWALFYLTVVVVYVLARRLWSSRPLALLASLFLVMQPRIFSHSFYDSVDISFLAFYTGSVFTLVRYLDRRTIKSLILHAVVCGVAIDVRSLGGIIPVITMGFLALELVAKRKSRVGMVFPFGRMVGFGVMVFSVVIVLWPYLWTNPLLRMLDVLRYSPRANWEGLVLYGGSEVIATQLPWHYVPVWILITTPIVCSVCFVVGLFELAKASVQRPLLVLRERLPELAIAAAVIAPVAAVILLKAVVYDGWRHLFFIYPSFVLVAVAGVKWSMGWLDRTFSLRSAMMAKRVVGAMMALNLAVVGWTMVRYHPYQNVYFNRLAGRNLKEISSRFEMDFWGLSYLNALKHVMASNPDRTIAIYHSDNALLAINRLALSAADQGRIQQVEFDEAEFVLTTFRQVREGYPDLEEYYAIEVDGAKILGVYRKAPAGK